VRGRASIPWSKRIEYDVQYVENFNLWLDLKILLKTVVVVALRQGTYYDYEKYGSAFDLTKKEKNTGKIH
ncbi:sugar transferase, partial [Planctomycetota bacterium]